MDRFRWLLGIAALVLVGMLGYGGITAFKQSQSYICTNGLSVRHVVSDEAVWNVTVRNESNSVKVACEKLKKDRIVVIDFLRKCGFSEDELSENSVEVRDKERWGDKLGKEQSRFEVELTISVKTRKMPELEKATIALVELAERDIKVSASARYLYKDMDKLRVEMISEATKDSENRAINIANSVGAKIAGIRNLATGHFSIVPEDSSATAESSWNEESSMKKKIRVVVHGTFNLG